MPWAEYGYLRVRHSRLASMSQGREIWAENIEVCGSKTLSVCAVRQRDHRGHNSHSPQARRAILQKPPIVPDEARNAGLRLTRIVSPFNGGTYGGGLPKPFPWD